MIIGENIKKLRLEKRLTQNEIAKRLGVSCQAVSKWENNVSAPDISLLPEIADFFGVSLDVLFGRSVSNK